MQYYFPEPIDTLDIPKNKGLLKYTFNSGENAIRLLLRSYKLPAKSKVAVPLFVCDSLKTAVIKEGLQPFYLDIKENSYWTNYDIELIKKNGVSAIILVHLYGFIHPDTKAVTEYCKQNNIPLVHDMAQCYGAVESQLTYGDIVYSFGPGKSSTAAGGGLLKSIDQSLYIATVKSPSLWAGVKAKLFVKSRKYGYSFTATDRILQRLVGRFNNEEITSMSPLQKDAAEYVMGRMDEIVKARKERYEALVGYIKKSPELSIAYDDSKGLYFKCVINVKGDVTRFKEHCTLNKVPYYSLFDSITIGMEETADKPWFILNAKRFVEISTEAAIPLEEIKRVGQVLADFN